MEPANDNASAKHGVGNLKSKILKSNLWDYIDPYILVRGDIYVTAAPATQVDLTNTAPFAKYFTKYDGTTIDYVVDLGLVMPMYNLIEYSLSYSDATRILCLKKSKPVKQLILMQILLMIIILNFSNFLNEVLS